MTTQSSSDCHMRKIQRQVPHAPLKDYPDPLARPFAWLGNRHLLARRVDVTARLSTLAYGLGSDACDRYTPTTRERSMVRAHALPTSG
jgi:hypothetical protein